MGMNTWSFTGHLGRDVEVRQTASGEPVAQFSVAVTSGYGDKQQTTWPRCAFWGKRGEAVARYLVKGQLVGVTGEVTLREYDGKDGTRKQSLEVRVVDLTLLGKRDETATPTQHPATPAAALDDDVPF